MPRNPNIVERHGAGTSVIVAIISFWLKGNSYFVVSKFSAQYSRRSHKSRRCSRTRTSTNGTLILVISIVVIVVALLLLTLLSSFAATTSPLRLLLLAHSQRPDAAVVRCLLVIKEVLGSSA